MTIFKNIGATFLITIYTVASFATSYGPVYPYTQMTEDKRVKSISVPYAVNDGGYGPGQTFVYAKGRHLYTIDKYFLTPFFTINNGQYLVEFNFFLKFTPSSEVIDGIGYLTVTPKNYKGDAVNIYKDGKLFKTIDFTLLRIDTAKFRANRLAWNYRIDSTNNDTLKMKMFKNPAFIENDKLYLITVDNQLIGIDVATGQITDRQNAYETIKEKTNWSPTIFKRVYNEITYPREFLLPKLISGKTIEQGLAKLLNKKAANDNRHSATIKIYFHTLLINKKGRCEVIYTSTSIDGISNANAYICERDFENKIEKWIKKQKFQTKTFPKGFLKYKYKDFVYLK